MGYRYLGKHWAENGYASMHVQHAGSDRSVWGGNVFQVFDRLRDAAQDEEAVSRVRDMRFALDTLLGDATLGPLIDGNRIAAAGHSYGANTTLLLSGAQVSRDGRPVDFRDTRIRGAVAISAPPFYGETELNSILGSVNVPSLHITSTDDVIRIPGFYSGPSDRESVFDAIGNRSKWFVKFNAGSHSSFVGRAGSRMPVLAATQQLTAAFMAKLFGGDERALAAWSQTHRSLVAKYVAPSPRS